MTSVRQILASFNLKPCIALTPSWKHYFIQFDKSQWNFSLFCTFSLINHNEIWAYSAQMVFFNIILLCGVCDCLSPCCSLSMAELMLHLASAATDENCLGPEGMEKFCEDIGVEPENVSEQNYTCMTRLHASYLFVIMLWMVWMHAEKEGGEKGQEVCVWGGGGARV